MFEELADDSVFEIIEYLDPNSVISFSKTSKRNHEVTSSNILWEKLYNDYWRPTKTEKKEIENSTEIIPLREINYFLEFKKRQFKYNKWKKNLVRENKFFCLTSFLGNKKMVNYRLY